MKQLRLFTLVATAVACLAGRPDSARANDIAHFKTVFNTDFASAAVGGLRNIGSGTIHLAGVTGVVTEAHLYWHGPMNSTNPLANATLTLNGQTITGQNIGFSHDNCWKYDNSQAYRADVTSFVAARGNGSYAITGLYRAPHININGASLLVFFNDGRTNNNRDIVLFDGNDSNASNPYDADGWNVLLQDIRYVSGTARFQLHVSDGQVWRDEPLVLNGTVIARAGGIFQGEGQGISVVSNGPENNGCLWDIKNYDVTSFLTPGTNTFGLTHSHIPDDDCVSIVVAAIDLPTGSAPRITPMGIQCPADIHATMDAGRPCAVVNYALPAADPGVSVVCSPASGSEFHLGVTPVICVATSTNGESATCSFNVRVTDNEAPRIVCPQAITRNVDAGQCSAVVVFAAVPSDNQSGVTYACVPPSGSTFEKGVTTVNCTATDTGGLTGTCSFTVTVRDTLAPTLGIPTEIVKVAEAGKSTAVVTFDVSLHDNCPGATLALTLPSGSVFSLGRIVVTATATDTSGNVTTGTFAVTILDGERPVVTMPTNIVTGTDSGKCSAKVDYSVSVTDNAAGASVRCEPPSGTEFPKGITLVTCVASDASGNSVTNSFSVTVHDTEPPQLNCPANIVKSPDYRKNGAVVTFNVGATDNCPGVTVCSVPASGCFFPIGSTPVTVTATDASGNKSTCTFTVSVRDGQPPVIVCPPRICVNTDPGQCAAVVRFNLTVRDNAPGSVVVCQPPSGSSFPKGTTIVRCTATDVSGNTASASFPVTVIDCEKPVILAPPQMVVNTDPGKPTATVTPNVNATDNCPGVRVSFGRYPTLTLPIGTNRVLCTATDASGNFSQTNVIVVVRDVEPPVIKSLTASPNVISRYKGKLKKVDLKVVATDNSGKTSCRVISVTSSDAPPPPDDGACDHTCGCSTNGPASCTCLKPCPKKHECKYACDCVCRSGKACDGKCGSKGDCKCECRKGHKCEGKCHQHPDCEKHGCKKKGSCGCKDGQACSCDGDCSGACGSCAPAKCHPECDGKKCKKCGCKGDCRHYHKCSSKCPCKGKCHDQCSCKRGDCACANCSKYPKPAKPAKEDKAVKDNYDDKGGKKDDLPAGAEWIISGPLEVKVLADCSNAGRTYTITVECKDSSGNTATASVPVRIVPESGK